jgi:hypothetical protein
MRDVSYNVAEFSPCRTYRYTLWRRWLFGTGYINFICLNPSTADEVQNDNTVRRCMKWAASWGFGAVCVTNIFAFRATDPRVMKAHADPIGPENDHWIKEIATGATVVVAAWGQHAAHLDRSAAVRKLLAHREEVYYLRMGKTEPWHPLYLPDSSKPILWEDRQKQC